MLVLMIGDIVGRPGRWAVQELLPDIRRRHSPNLVIANGENAAGGFGLTSATAEELFGAGIDVLTSGNHIWAQKEIIPYLDSNLPILRPLNYPASAPGRGYLIKNGVLVANIIGRTFMDGFDCPFRAMDRLLGEVDNKTRMVVVDFHAEATSEKVAMGYYLDGRVSAVLGTHTHVSTTDARRLPQGTAYITDVGMTGPIDSVIGVSAEAVIQRFLTAIPHRLTVAKGRSMLSGVLVGIDDASGRALNIEHIYYEVD